MCSKPSGTIKTVPEDFVVIESGYQPIFRTRLTGAAGPYTRFLLTRRDIEYEKAIAEVARQLGVERKRITTQGRKDAFAVTTQLIAVEGAFRPTFAHDRVWLRQLGPSAYPLRLGGHSGNHFEINVYTSSSELPEAPEYFRNLFGPQRFGDIDPNVGRYLLEGDFIRAAGHLRGSPHAWGGVMSIARQQRCDHIEALQTPAFTAKAPLYLQQWQSHLWNQLARQAGPEVSELPLWSADIRDLYTPWWNPTSLDREMYELLEPAHRGVSYRDLWVNPREHQVTRHQAGWRHAFVLPPGAFATVFLADIYDLHDASRAWMKQDHPPAQAAE